MRKSVLMASAFLPLLLFGVQQGQTQDSLGFLQFQPEMKVEFDGTDPAATQTARKMYGKDFRLVEAKRIWLKDQDTNYEQLAVRLSTERQCDKDCTYAVLFYDDTQWLELWRGKAEELQFGPIGPNGLRGIYDGHRMWSWTGATYWPNLSEYKFKYRDIKPEEKQVVDRSLAGASGDIRDDTRYYVLDLPLVEGTGALVSISSIYYCGQSFCDTFVLSKDGALLGNYTSRVSQAGPSSTRDTNGNPLIETVTAKGISAYRIGEKEPAYVIDAQTPIIAGKAR